MTLRSPAHPTDADWSESYAMLCGYCDSQLRCEIVDAMIEAKSGGPWPEGGWVSDPGAGITCLSYVPRPVKRLPRQQLRALARTPEANLPPVCGGCAARKGSEASTALHTQRDYQAAVRNQSPFNCHEDPLKKRPCGGWCRAVMRKRAALAQPTGSAGE